MTRQELADAVNHHLWTEKGIREYVTVHDIGRLERGETRWPRQPRRTGLRAVLGADNDAQLGLYPNRNTRSSRLAPTTPGAAQQAFPSSIETPSLKTVIDMMPVTAPRRSFLQGIAMVAAACGLAGQGLPGRRIGANDLDRLTAVTALYRSADYEYGGGMLYEEVDRFADRASALLDGSYSDSLAPRLLAAVAVVRQLAGWTAFDSCRHSEAQRHFLAAERVASAAGDELLAARVRYCQARQLQHLRHNRDALDTLRLAREKLGSRATPAVSTMLDGARAASLAAVGDRHAAVAALGEADEHFDKVDMSREPEWMRFYDRGELLAQHGRVYRDLARADRRYGRHAVRVVTDAIDSFGPHNARSGLLNTVGLCSALFLADEPEQAVTVGTRAIEQTRDLASPRTLDRVRNVRHDLTRHQTLPTVAPFARRLATITGTP